MPLACHVHSGQNGSFPVPDATVSGEIQLNKARGALAIVVPDAGIDTERVADFVTVAPVQCEHRCRIAALETRCQAASARRSSAVTETAPRSRILLIEDGPECKFRH